MSDKVETKVKATKEPKDKKEKASKKEKKVKSKKSKNESSEKKEKKPRVYREVNKESVDNSFKEIIDTVISEIETLRDSKEKVKGVKFLRSVNKKLKVLHKDYLRVLKMKKKTKNTNTDSGFMKPVTITEELAKFMNKDVSGEYSSVEVTIFICAYIKVNDLQNPSDRRQILADDKLCKLLAVEKSSLKEQPLTYFRLQQLIQRHFPKSEKSTKKDAKEQPKEDKKPVKESAPSKPEKSKKTK
jgi:chromatin remodeling complex protein RSC6